ncbi:MAG: GTP-binding protein [Pseudomonadota bacterium]
MDPFAPAFPGELLPVSIITGFLGSGKSTLLGQLLRQPDMGKSAVIVNELGEVGLDHILVERIEGEVCLLQSGCVCCSLRGDLEQALQKLIDQRERGVITRFDRVVIETTGLADPAPILQLALTSPMIQRYFKLDAVVTTVDAVNGQRQLDENPESVKQAALADRILLTKTDLVSPDQLDRLDARLARLNPAAPRFRVLHGRIEAARLFNADPTLHRAAAADVAQWLGPQVSDSHDTVLAHAHGACADHVHAPGALNHDSHINHFSLNFDQPLDWLTVAQWLSDLCAQWGEKLLRIKGVLDLVGEPRPVAIHAIHHTFHPPLALSAWPDEKRGSRIVFITRDLSREVVQESWREAARMD